mgnify:CR=1 FL=1
MKKLIIIFALGLFLTGNVFAATSCYTDTLGNTTCSDGTSAYSDSLGNTTITSPNGQMTHCYTDTLGNTTCN